MSRRGFLTGGAALAGGAVLTGTADATPAQVAATRPGAPPIIDCDGWGARPSSRTVPVLRARPVRIIVHHTAGPNRSTVGQAAAEQLARSIQDFHMDRRGWIDSGQHFTISRGGFVLEGRRHSLEALSSGRRHVVGSHCTGQNEVAVGIENEGTYGAVVPPRVQLERLRRMCAHLCAQYGIEPTEIHGHRDYRDTDCPGDRLHGLLPNLRIDVARILGVRLTRTRAVRPIWPLLRSGDGGPPVLAAQYLLRAAGITELVPDGRFGSATNDAVHRFQSERACEEINGMIGGESWPLLTRDVPVDGSGGGDGALAVQALRPAPPIRTAQVTGEPHWQLLLGTVG